jgi:CHAT domain-containing protein
LSNLGELLQAQGQLEAARPYVEQVLAIKKKTLPVDHPHVSIALSHVGYLLRLQGQLEAARPYYEQALAIDEKSLPVNHPDLATSRINLASLLLQQGRREEAWPLVTAGATTWAAGTRRQAAGSAHADHVALISQRRGTVLGLLFNAAVGMKQPRAAQLRELLALALDSKAISTTVLAERRLLVDADPEARALADRLTPLRRRLADLLLQGPGPRTPAQYRRECDDLQRQANELERELALRVRALGDLERAERAGPDELAARLAPGEALIECVRYRTYDFRTRHWGAARYAAVLLGRGAKDEPWLRLVPLGAAAPLEKVLHAWRTQAQKGRIDEPSERALRQLLWEPLARALPEKTTRLVIAPDGELALLPFEALRLDDGKYLIERYAVRYVSTGRDLMPLPRPKARSATALVLADPAYDSVGEPKTLAGEPGMRFASLPGFVREADTVARLLQGRPGWTERPLRRLQASEEALAAVKRPRLLYCITHGFFLHDLEPAHDLGGLRKLELVGTDLPRQRINLGQDPRLRSGLALTGANQWQERSAKGLSDGLLTALEVEELDLWGTELAVLSACETGRGEVQVGEGVLGLRRAFQIAGARTVLASLWQVPDTETERLMTECLKRWLDGAPPAEALRQAQLELLRRLRQSTNANRQAAPPLYWAGFICHGQR